MEPLYQPLERSERLITLGRVALAGFSLLAIWLDPTAPARWAQLTYTLLAAYLAYALLLVPLVWAAGRFLGRLGLVTHVVDLPIFTAFLYLTEGPTSPLFAYFVFALLAAALRWRWRGVMWTAAATLTIFVGLGVYAQAVLDDPAFELNRFIIRTVYLSTAALFLGYLSAYEEELREKLAKLAGWPRGAAPGLPVQDALRHAAAVLGVPRALLIWEEPEEPWRHLTVRDGEGFRHEREPVAATGPPVAEALADADFLCRDIRSPRPTVLRTGADGPRRWRGAPLAPDLQRRLDVRSVVGVRVRGEQLEGRLLFLDKHGLTSDDLVLGGIVARQVAADLDQFYLRQRLQRAAAAEERARFARELHDGALQTLAGTALRLKALERVVTTDPGAAGRALAEIGNALAAEQRELRFYLRQLRPIPLSLTEPNAGLAAHLHELAKRSEHQWGLRVDLTLAPMARQLPESLAHEIGRLVQEALANAARHGRATVARVRLGLQGDEVVLTVADNGRGFAFRGRLDLAALSLKQTGPASIRERVAALDGELIVDRRGRPLRPLRAPSPSTT